MKAMKKNILNCLIVLALFFLSANISGCGSKMKENPFKMDESTSKTTSIDEMNVAPPPSTTVSEFNKKSEAPGVISDNKDMNETTVSPTSDKIEDNKEIVEKVPSKIIKTANIKYQVKKYEDSRKKILSLVQQTGAYVQSENQTSSDKSIDNTIVIRIKSDGFDNLVEKLLEESIYTDSKSIVADDVTEQFVDIQSRVKSKKEVELQYLILLKKANTINEILQVQQYIRTIREEIDSYEGRLKYMSDRAAYSTINLTFYEKIPFTIAPSPENSFLYRIGNAFSGGWKAVLMLCVGIIALWPLWVLGGITLIVILRLVKRKKK